MANETATSEKSGMQDAANRVEAILFGDDKAGNEDPKAKAAAKDELEAKALPKADDVIVDEEEDPELDEDKDEDKDKDKLDEIAADEELSMAEYLGIEEDRLSIAEDGSVGFEAIIDGEKKVVPLKELASSFQMQGHVNNKSMALETERTEFNEQKEAITQELQNRILGLEKLTEVLESELVSEYQGINWDTLRAKNPAEWTAKRQEFSERAQKLKQNKALVSKESEGIKAKQLEEFQETRNKYIAAESTKMLAANPTWSDPTVLKAAQEGMRTFLNKTYGYVDEDFASVSDSRLIAVIQDAQKYRNGKLALADKKVKKLPKFRKPGANRASSADVGKVRKTKALRAAVKKGGGRTQDVANLLLDRM